MNSLQISTLQFHSFFVPHSYGSGVQTEPEGWALRQDLTNLSNWDWHLWSFCFRLAQCWDYRCAWVTIVLLVKFFLRCVSQKQLNQGHWSEHLEIILPVLPHRFFHVSPNSVSSTQTGRTSIKVHLYLKNKKLNRLDYSNTYVWVI